MAAQDETQDNNASLRERVTQQAQSHPVAAAAILGGAVAAGAGAYFGTKALARRNERQDGRRHNSVMETAITACDLKASQRTSEPPVGREPYIAREPSVRIP